jgi:DNA polymerase-3 subunit beta
MIELDISSQDLGRAMSSIMGVVERSPKLPVLGHVLLLFQENMLSLYGSDGDLTLQLSLPVACTEQQGCCVAARRLYEITRTAGEAETLHLQWRQNRLTISGSGYRYTLATLDEGDFPSLMVENSDLGIVVRQGALRTLLERTAFAMAQQDLRFFLNGVFLHGDTDRLTAVATDSHRLALDGAPIEQQEVALQAILPRKTVHELRRLLSSKEEDMVRVQRDEEMISFHAQQWTLQSKTVAGRYPDYRAVLPKETSGQLRLDRQALLMALRRAALVSDEVTAAELALSESGDLVITAGQNEQFETRLAVQVTGQPLQAAYNIRYLTDALGVVEAPEVELGYVDGGLGPLTIHDSTAPSWLGLVMPIRL